MATILMRRRWRWIGHVTRQDCLALDTRGKAKEGSSEDHVAADGGERNATDGKDLEQHFSRGEGPAEVEGSRAAVHASRRNGHE